MDLGVFNGTQLYELSQEYEQLFAAVSQAQGAARSAGACFYVQLRYLPSIPHPRVDRKLLRSPF